MKACPTCGRPQPDNEFRVEYLCVLTGGCTGRGTHSVACVELNEKRAEALRAREATERRDRINSEINWRDA